MTESEPATSFASGLAPALATRRQFLRDAVHHASALGAAALAPSLATSLATGCASSASPRGSGPHPRQSIAGWCFLNQGPKWDIETLARTAAELGCGALELVEPKHWPVLRRYGLVSAATRSHTFVRGMNNPGHWPECLGKLRAAIEVTAAARFSNVMTFTGLLDTRDAPRGSLVDPDEGIDHCVAGYKQIVGVAERAGVTLILEPLNTRDPRPMRGHPGYLGDHVDECVEIIRRVGSPNLKLLFDVYHVQVMDGDLIRRIRELSELIAHVQVAGCPGRGPLDGRQEIHYPAVAQALADVGYGGFIGHEWIADGNAREQLAASIAACAVRPGLRGPLPLKSLTETR